MLAADSFWKKLVSQKQKGWGQNQRIYNGVYIPGKENGTFKCHLNNKCFSSMKAKKKKNTKKKGSQLILR